MPLVFFFNKTFRTVTEIPKIVLCVCWVVQNAPKNLVAMHGVMFEKAIWGRHQWRYIRQSGLPVAMNGDPTASGTVLTVSAFMRTGKEVNSPAPST
ncbi:hypothetical protein C1Y42_07615 [Pantoea sp. ICBG 985]|nr:hypothetical protein C1Y42_07615 [Pantoea sp. ICBG 985]